MIQPSPLSLVKQLLHNIPLSLHHSPPAEAIASITNPADTPSPIPAANALLGQPSLQVGAFHLGGRSPVVHLSLKGGGLPRAHCASEVHR